MPTGKKKFNRNQILWIRSKIKEGFKTSVIIEKLKKDHNISATKVDIFNIKHGNNYKWVEGFE